ncbi:hypothetical protein [Vibrio sp. MA40-2]|uniref:hypothetical protein n=1 Tax=Vibrio sp. MA40-2 TaxID=3391828 RepID=UPI0039A5B98A
MILRRVQHRLIIALSLILMITACIPIIRTEYISPNWQGTLVDRETGKPLIDVEIRDLYTLKKVKTDQNGYFQLPAETSEFSFKLPVANMMGIYQIEVSLPQYTLHFTGTRRSSITTPSDFNLGIVPIALSKNIMPFFLANDQVMIELPKHFIETCGEPLQDAIRLTNVARLYKQRVTSNVGLGEFPSEQQDIERSYYWANQSWQEVSTVCFRENYEQVLAFREFNDLFYQEAEPYLVERIIDFGDE